MTKDVLIVGQGLAGTLLANECLNQGKAVLVIDNHSASTSSKVAAGMFTPVSGKRMAKSWMAETLIPFALQTYRQLEHLLQTPLLKQQDIYQVIASVKEQNDLMSRLENKDFADYLNTRPEKETNLIEPFGAFGITQSGWVDLPKLLAAFRAYLEQQQTIATAEFDYTLLTTQENQWVYGQQTFNHVVFCEGHAYHQNPFFKSLIPYTPTKGDVLTIKCSGITDKRIVKKGIYLIALGDGLYKVGATYEREHLNAGLPNPEAKAELIDKLHEFLDVPFEVIAHEAGIRPTTRDRRPLLGEHPHHKNMYLFNGLGAKGVMLGPWFAHLMVKNIFEREVLPKEISLTRFNTKQS